MIEATARHNPFRARASEQQRDLLAFLRNFGVGALDLLPDGLWDRPLIIRSAPGGGKTSLMRLFAIDSLRLVHARRADLEPLAVRLTEAGALSDGGPTRLGIILSLDRDYRMLPDIEAGAEADVRLFFRLLDSRIAVAVLRAALAAAGLVFPGDISRVRLVPAVDQSAFTEATNRLGGTTGPEILRAARRMESELLELLDSLLPVHPEGATQGHSDLYSLRLLGNARIEVDGVTLDLQPLVMFDDGHDLASSQRRALLNRLVDRGLGLARWYAERYEALSSQELLAGDIEGRDYELVEIEAAARGLAGRGRGRVRFDRLLADVGNRRAAPTLMRYGEDHQSFSELLEVGREGLAGVRASELVMVERLQAESIAQGARHAEWLADARLREGYDAALRWRELAIIIARDRDRPTLELFDFTLDEADAERLSGGAIREAAALFVARDHRLAYYFGPDALAKLGSQNIEQYLTVAGELFEAMLVEVTLNRSPRLTAQRQDAVIRQVSERLWRTLPRRLPHGRDVQRLLVSIVALARRETFRPTAPYAPGVTGIALSMADRELLLDSATRARIPGAERLHEALAAAISYNVLTAELDRPSKGDRVMVLYLNRLLCPRFGLPLGRGGFRERRLGIVAGWMLEPDIDPAEAVELELGLR